MTASTDRPGDVRLAPGALPREGNAAITFIGAVRSASPSLDATPKNPTKARERGHPAVIEIAAPFRPGLEGLAQYSHIIVLGWLHEARRDIIQVTRPHDNSPRGVFSLRAPVRPNPIAVSVVRLRSLDIAAGQLEIDDIDFLDGTPIVDIKPYRPGIDAVPEAVVP